MKKTNAITLTKKGSLCVLLNSTRAENPTVTLINPDRLGLLSLAIKEKQKSPHLILTTAETEQDLGPLDPDTASELLPFLAKGLLAGAKRGRLKKGLGVLAIALLITGGLSIGGLSVGGLSVGRLLALNPDHTPPENTLQTSRLSGSETVNPAQTEGDGPRAIPAEDWLRQQP